MTALDVFDALLPGQSWTAWRTVVAALFGLPMSDAELALFRKHTGRQAPRPGGYHEAAIVVGVQSGKTRFSAVLADYAALTGEPGTTAILVAQDHRAALRALLGYARAPFETVPSFRAEVSRETADAIELRRGTRLAAYPCRPSAVRGLRGSGVFIDELAFFQATDGRPVDVEMLRACRGRVATTSGKLVIISSPYAQSGALFDLHRRHYGRDDSATLVWQASAPEMNPTLPADYIERMRVEDPTAYESEVLGQFRAGVSTLFDAAIVAEAVPAGIHERAPEHGVDYIGFADAASGSGKDAFTLAIAHADGRGAVLDCVRAWTPPFNPSGVVAEAADTLKRYRVDTVSGDRYAGGFVSEQFRANGIAYRPSDRDRSALYLGLLPLVNSGQAVLLDHADLLRELRGLERRRGMAGRDKVDHMSGAHDDIANAAAGALVLASEMATETPLELLSGLPSGSDLYAELERLRGMMHVRLGNAARRLGSLVAGRKRDPLAPRTAEEVTARKRKAADLRTWRRAERDVRRAEALAAKERQQYESWRTEHDRERQAESEYRVLRAIARTGVYWPGD